MGPHGGRRMKAAAMIDLCKKLRQAENLSSCSFSAFCAATAVTHHAAMMNRIGGREEATDSAWRLPSRRLRSRPPWSVGACLLANLPGKITCHNNPQHLSARGDLKGQQRPPWCPTPGPAAHTSRPECWLIVICGGARSGAPWRPWDNGGRHGW